MFLGSIYDYNTVQLVQPSDYLSVAFTFLEGHSQKHYMCVLGNHSIYFCQVVLSGTFQCRKCGLLRCELHFSECNKWHMEFAIAICISETF